MFSELGLTQVRTQIILEWVNTQEARNMFSVIIDTRNPSLLGIFAIKWFESGNNADLSETLTKELCNAKQENGTGHMTDLNTLFKEGNCLF